jgi:tetratricopeptide (TPR) repeat protein
LIPVPIDRPAILRNAEKLLRSGKLDQAIAEYLRIVEDQPGDWNTANVLGDLYVRARQTDRAVEQFVRIADHLHNEGFLPKAAAVYKKVLKLKPDHEHAMLQAGEIAGTQGLAADARTLLNGVAERRRARGDERGVAEIAVRLATLDPNDFGARMSGARTRVALDDVPGAIADLKSLAAYMQEKERLDEARQALQEALALDPQDPDLRAQLGPDDHAGGGDFGGAPESASTAEQLESLAEQFDAIGRGDPGPQHDFDAFRAKPDMRRETQSALPADLADAYIAAGQGDQAQAIAEALVSPEPDPTPAAVDLAQIFDEVAVAPATPVAKGRSGEVDLSVALDDIKRPAQASRMVEAPPAGSPDVLPGNSAEENYRLGLSLYEAGRVDDALAPLQAASRAPKLRFLAASLVGRIYRDRGEFAPAVEWLERAAQAPAPTPDDGHMLLFDLAEALEQAGETSRALAVCMELQADAGNYRDVAARIDRLARVRARG